MRQATMAVAPVVAALVVGCAPRHEPALPVAASPPACRDLADGYGRPVSAELRWHAPSDTTDQRLTAWCGTVGPGVFHPARQSASSPTSNIVIVSWNVHVGSGDLTTIIHEVRAGRFSGGSAPDGFVLLLQEAVRGGASVPRTVAPDAPVPDRVEATSPGGTREDVAEVADREGLTLLYLPSMRNGRESDSRSEDRGNAILATFDLADPIAVELPLGRQRRVAVAATVSGRDSLDRPWRLRVVSVHLDASTGPRQLWLFTSAQRERQARYLVEALDDDAVATVVGADLNTWAGGTREPAFRAFRREFPQIGIGPRFAGWFTLDYVFFRLPSDWQVSSRPADSTFGSDHRPVVSLVKPGT